MSKKYTVRPPTAAGLFYEILPEILRENIEGYLENARVPNRKVMYGQLYHPMRDMSILDS